MQEKLVEFANLLRENGVRVSLREIQCDRIYRDLINACLDIVEPIVGRREGGMCRRSGYIFVSSPAATTPLHFDPEHSFLLQVSGEKHWTFGSRPAITNPAIAMSAYEVASPKFQMQSAMLGVFISLDLFLFYIFWDAMLIPMYFLIGIWGYDRRVYAAVKFILYTMAGSVLMLLAILALAYLHSVATGAYSFDLLRLYELQIPPQVQFWCFLAFALAFAIKVPLFPFHTWLPDAHVEAPTAGSVILAGVLLKMGTYGFVRFAFPLFPVAATYFAPYLATLAVVGIIYGALVAMVQPDMKKLVAYSSVSHLGFVVLGIAAMNTQGVQGAVYQMLNHGVSTGGLFLIVGMLSDRRHTRLIAEYGGLKRVAPHLVAVFLIVTLSSIGLPGLNGFVGEFLILLGAFRWSPRAAAFAATGVILSATYMLWMFQRVNYGPVSEKNAGMRDLSTREWAVLVPIVAMTVLMGVLPNILLRPIEPSVERMLSQVRQGAGVQIHANALPIDDRRLPIAMPIVER